MEQNKKPVIIAVVVTAVVVVGLGSIGLNIKSQIGKKVVVNYGAASISGSDNTSAAGIAPVNSSSSGLSVSASGSSAQDLGQLSGSSNSGSQGTQGSSSQNSSGSGASQAFDPSTFSQYDKYKTETKALFGDVEPGTGAAATETSKVAVYYKGWLTNGTLFDQSRPGSDGKLTPFVFTMGSHQVIPGWEQGIVGMKVGGTRLLIVPPSVGYGAAGQGTIPGNALLVFEVQLLAVQ